MMKLLLIVSGTISLCFGIAGIMIPGLPTTPFLLLTAGLYIRSSERLYTMLIHHKILGPYITNYSGGMNNKVKIRVILTMWTMVLLSAFLLFENITPRIVMILAGITGTIVVSMLPSGK